MAKKFEITREDYELLCDRVAELEARLDYIDTPREGEGVEVVKVAITESVDASDAAV